MPGMLQTVSAPAEETRSEGGLATISYPSQLASILLFGHDPKLLQTRSWVFQRNDFTVHPVSSEREFQAELSRRLPGVILLCQTLSAHECESAAAYAEEHAPQTNCILLYSRETSWRLQRKHVLLNSNEGPRVLVETVRSILECERKPAQV